MQLGMIGLGRMGGNIVRRLMKQGHTAVVYDKDPKAVAALVPDGAVGAGDYVALLAYIERDHAHIDTLQHMRLAVRDKRHVATCAEFGPRFLHSTGQAYKGGPGSGVFLQITADDAEDLAVPGQKASFGVIKAAQARGDFDVLTERGRRALRVHLKGDLKSALAMLDAAIQHALN